MSVAYSRPPTGGLTVAELPLARRPLDGVANLASVAGLHLLSCRLNQPGAHGSPHGSTFAQMLAKRCAAQQRAQGSLRHDSRGLEDDPMEVQKRLGEMAAPALSADPPLVATGVPLAAAPAQPTSAIAACARVSLEELLPALVRKVAWSSDGHRGAVRLELGAGALSGATVFVQSDGGRVEVQVSVPPGVDVEAWRRRIAERLTARGLDVARVDVD